VKRIGYFVILFAGALGAFMLLLVWYLASFQAGHGSLTGLMGQMMGNQNAGGMTTAMPGYVWLGATVLVGLVIAGVVGLSYSLALPEIKTSQASAGVPKPADLPKGPAEQSKQPETVDWSVMLRTSTPEEKKVLEVLASHGGKYLQKFVVKEAGLSRLKTHRIISRFAERGVVTAVHTGNTNEIALAPWLMKDAAPPSP